MASLLTRSSSGYYRMSNMFSGYESKKTALTPSAGSNTSQWKADVDWWGHSGDVCASSESGGVESEGTNGDKHWQIVKVGVTHGHYFSAEITGFKFKVAQNSGAGHGLYVKRYGFSLAQKTGGSSYFYDAGGDIGRGSYGTKNHSHTFTSTVLNNYLKNGWVFDEFRYQVSSEGGTGKRWSQVIVYDFQFNYVGSSGKHLILPRKRSYSDRDKFPIA